MKVQPITTPGAQALIREICSGTTSRTDDYRVLWLGVNLALVRWHGYIYEGRWWPATVSRYERSGCREWDCMKITRQTPLTQAVLDKLIADAEVRDAGWEAKLAAAAAAEKVMDQAREARQAAEQEVRNRHGELLDAALNVPTLLHLTGTGEQVAAIYAAMRYRRAVEALDALKEQS